MGKHKVEVILTRGRRWDAIEGRDLSKGEAYRIAKDLKQLATHVRLDGKPVKK